MSSVAGDGARPGPKERIAAATALAMLVVAMLVAIAGVTRNLGSVLAGIACLAVLGLAGWYAVSRAGKARAIAIAIGVGSLALFVVAVLAADLEWPRVVGSLAAAAVSIAAARRALRPPQALPRAEPGARLARGPEVAGHASARGSVRSVLLMNPKSGGGKVERFHLVDECRRRGIEPVVLGPGDDLRELAEDAVARAGAIGMAGGDGSQALVAWIASRHDVPMVVVPAGTRNHFALDIGLDRDDVVGALDAFRDGAERRIDLATVNGRVFVNNAALGLYARIVQSPGYRDAKLRTSAAMLPELLGPDAAPFDLAFTGPDGTEHPMAHLVLVSNNPYHLESLAGIGTRERLDGGVLGIVAARIANAAQWEQLLALETVGQVRRFSGWMQWEAGSFEIRSSGRVDIGVDGEALAMDPPLVFTSIPSALRLRLPPRARQASHTRKGVRPIAATVASLGRVVAGHAPDGGSTREAVPAVAFERGVPT